MLLKYTYKPKPNKTLAIFVALYQNGGVQIISTGQRCAVTDWNKDKNLPVNESPTNKLYKEIKKVKDAVEKVWAKMEYEGKIVTPVSLKVEYNNSKKETVVIQQRTDKATKAELVTVATLVDRYLVEGMDHLKQSSRDTVKVSLETTFKEYIKNTAPNLERKDLTLEFVTNYGRYLTKNGYADSTHGKKMKHVRWFLKFIKFNSGDIRDVKIKNVKPDDRNIITLNKEELAALEQVDATIGSIEKQKAKDFFLLGCYLGLRVSDIQRIAPETIKNGCVTMTLKKNSKAVAIPILPKAKEILARYKNHAPRIHEQKVNDWIKVLCADAKINEITVFKTVIDKEVTEEKFKKYELITTHVAGKTFITLAQDWGLTPVEIAAIVGKSVKTVLGYYFDPNIKLASKKMIEGANRAQMKVIKRAS